MFQYCEAWFILRNGDVYIFEQGQYISALEHTKMLILSSSVLLACINKMYKYCGEWVI